MVNTNKDFLTVTELATMLGVSRVAIFKKIKNGQISAMRIGKMLAIPRKEFESILGKTLTKKQKEIIDRAVGKTVKEYGTTLRLLGQE